MSENLILLKDQVTKLENGASELEGRIHQLEQLVERMSSRLTALERKGREGVRATY